MNTYSYLVYLQLNLWLINRLGVNIKIILFLAFLAFGQIIFSQNYQNEDISKTKFDRTVWEDLRSGSKLGIEDYKSNNDPNNLEENENQEFDESKYNEEEIEDLLNEVEKEVEELESQEEDNPFKNSEQIDNPEEKEYDENANNDDRVRRRNNSNYSTSSWANMKWLQYLLIVIGIGLLAVIIYFLIFNSKGSKKGKKLNIEIESDEISPEDIPKSELELMLESALAENDYRKAIRIYYVFIIKDLSHANVIDWHKQKTNSHYQLEINKNLPSRSKGFEKITFLYELIWYGKREVTSSDFEKLKPQFEDYYKLLS